jgi:hypothetical protein
VIAIRLDGRIDDSFQIPGRPVGAGITLDRWRPGWVGA